MLNQKLNDFHALVFKNDKARLVLLSFLMLFVELTLIRWIGSNIFNLFFFSNLILLASFLGIGIGFLRVNSPKNLFNFTPFILALTIVFAYYCCVEYQVKVNPVTDDLDYSGKFFESNVYPVWLTLPIIFIVVTSLMATLANEVARNFQRFPPLEAYRLEILGSLSGVIVFSLLSFSHTAPLSWGLVLCALFLILLKKNNFLLTLFQITMLTVILATFTKEALNQTHFWSSYYKVDVKEYTGHRYAVNVNGLTQQVIESVEQRKKVKPFYVLPYEHRNKTDPLNSVLIIGAGTGGDVAIALAEGAQHIDAVEIDPRLYQLGRKLNPNNPYSDPRVHVYINDGRAFLQQTKNQYDLIIFALTDALMMIPGQSSMRLENYLYTLESLSMVNQRLKPDGVFTIYNYYGRDWIADRLGNTITRVFNHAPCFDDYNTKDYWATVLTVRKSQAPLQCKAYWQANESAASAPSTDNHPFLYLKENSLPPIYLVTLLFIFLVSFSAIKWLGGSFQAIRSNLDLFFMGAAFLLLETKSVVNFALFFGTTWFVNSLVFVGILTTVYFSIELAHRFTFKKPLFLYLALAVMLVLSWVIPNSYLLSLPAFARFMGASFLAFSPILIANLIFSSRFRYTTHSTEAFGANLLGAVLGGLLEYLSLIIGYQDLLLLVIGLYILAFSFNSPLGKRLALSKNI